MKINFVMEVYNMEYKCGYVCGFGARAWEKGKYEAVGTLLKTPEIILLHTIEEDRDFLSVRDKYKIGEEIHTIKDKYYVGKDELNYVVDKKKIIYDEDSRAKAEEEAKEKNDERDRKGERGEIRHD